MNRSFLYAAITAASIALLITGCGKKPQMSGSLKVPVLVKEVTSEDVPVYIDSFGTLSASESVDIKPRVTGQITQILFDEGSVVQKDQLLITLDTEQISASIINDQAAVAQTKADYDLKQYLVEKNLPLVGKAGFNKQDYEKMKTELLVAGAAIKSAQAKLLADTITMNYCSIRSPITGTIGTCKIDIGNVVTPNEILTNVKKIDVLDVDFTVPERNIDRIKHALEDGHLNVYISISSITNSGKMERGQYPGKLTFLTNEADASTGTMDLRATVPNKDNKLLPGQYVNVKLIVDIKKGAVLIPKEAVQLGSIGSYVYAVGADNKAKLVPVEVYNMYKDYYVMEKGDLTPGTKVAVTGLLNVSNGTELQIKSDTPSPEKAKTEEKAQK